MKLNEKYDDTDPLSIEKYSKKLIGKSFEEILFDYFTHDFDSFSKAREQFNNPYQKGSLGNLIEQYYFGYLPNSSPEPDFQKAGVELKVTPYEITKTGITRSGERLVLGMIPNNTPVPYDFEKSSAYNMLKLILLVLYFRDKEVDRIQHPIHYSQLVSLNSAIFKNDLEIIKSDYNIIVNKVLAGEAHNLSEADTMYLAASTKGSTAKRSLQPQYYNTQIKAKRRAFSLKQGYMSSVINNYILEDAQTYDVISDKATSKQEFEKIVIDKLKAYKGYSEDELRDKFNLVESESKDILSRISLKILNVNTNNAEEFEKSNTKVKTIRLEEDGSIKENMSFPAISFIEFAKEQWEDSDVYNYFSETRFLFVLFRNIDGNYHLHDAMFWNMPAADLEGPGKKDWLESQKVVREGVEFNISGKRVFNSIPNASATEIFHLRPKTNLSAYKIDSLNFERGDLEKDADKLPNGDFMTIQGFWVNKSYLEKIIKVQEDSSFLF